MISSKVPAAIRVPAMFFYLPYPLSFKLISPGTRIEGLMQAKMYPRENAICIGMSNNLFAMNATTVASANWGISDKKTTISPFPLKDTYSPPLISKVQRQTPLIHPVQG